MVPKVRAAVTSRVGGLVIEEGPSGPGNVLHRARGDAYTAVDVCKTSLNS